MKGKDRIATLVLKRASLAAVRQEIGSRGQNIKPVALTHPQMKEVNERVCAQLYEALGVAADSLLAALRKKPDVAFRFLERMGALPAPEVLQTLRARGIVDEKSLIQERLCRIPPKYHAWFLDLFAVMCIGDAAEGIEPGPLASTLPKPGEKDDCGL